MAVKRPAVLLAVLMIFSVLSEAHGLRILSFTAAFIFLAGAIFCISSERRKRASAILLLYACSIMYPAAYSFFTDLRLKNAGVSEISSEYSTYLASVYNYSYYGETASLYVELKEGSYDGIKALVTVKSPVSLPETHDFISFSGSLVPMNEDTVKQYSLFGSRLYYLSEGCLLYAEAEDFSVLGRPAQDQRGIALKYYYYISDNLRNCMPILGGTDMFSYVSALLTGDRTMLTEKVSDLYSRSGLMPFLCISGLHVVTASSILSAFMKKLRLNCLLRFSVLLLFLLFLCIITGAAGSVIRAAIMSAVLLSADMLEKNADPYSSISLAIVAVILLNPYAIFDLGTILSFLAMLGIIFAGVVNDIYLVLPRSRLYKIKRSLFTSFYASGFVMIPILSTFGGVYILSPFSNLAGSIIFAPIMYLLVLLAIFAFLPAQILKIALAVPAAALLKIFELTAEVFSKIPFSYAEFQCPQFLSAAFAIFITIHILCAAFAENKYIALTGFFSALLPQLSIISAHSVSIICSLFNVLN